MLGQAEIAKYLDQCNGDRTAIEEVLSAYIVWKYLKGATSRRILGKIRYLTIYLRVTGRQQILEVAADIFKILALEVTLGGERVGMLPSVTEPGKALWNRIRREPSYSSRAALVPNSLYGGPVSIQDVVSLAQRQPDTRETRTPWAERYFLARHALGAVPTIPDVSASQRATTLPLYTHANETQTTLPPYA